jgi:hypothetical protein
LAGSRGRLGDSRELVSLGIEGGKRDFCFDPRQTLNLIEARPVSDALGTHKFRI